MTEPKVFVAVPVYGGVQPSFMRCLLTLTQEAPVQMQVSLHAGDSLVSRARNSLTAKFLKTDCTHLLFLDSDLVFKSADVASLVGRERDVIGGFYPKKKEGPPEWVCNGLEEPEPPDSEGLQELRFIGTGFLLISRHALERMRDYLSTSIEYTNDETSELEWDLWPVGVFNFPDGAKRYLSEDWYFCQRWRDMGGQVFGDTAVLLQHIGQAVYPIAYKPAPEPENAE